MQNRLIIEQFDPDRPKPGGIDTCIRGLVKYAPPDVSLFIVGVDAVGNKKLGQWQEFSIGDGTARFMAVARLDHANLRRPVPHSVQLGIGLLRFRPRADAHVVQAHRINMGLLALMLYRSMNLVQFLHSSGVANLGAGSKSWFRVWPQAYRAFEQIVMRHAADTVVFSREGADRLRMASERVRFSPTWFDPEQFYFKAPRPQVAASRLLWACRVEPAKNPLLAVRAFARLPPTYLLTVAGNGTLLSSMKREAARCGVESRIQFVGAVNKDSMGDLFRSHDILVMSSVFEGFSRSIVEALACGVPVVTTPGGDPNDLIVAGFNGGRYTDEHDFMCGLAQAEASSSANCVASVADLDAPRLVSDLLALQA